MNTKDTILELKIAYKPPYLDAKTLVVREEQFYKGLSKFLEKKKWFDQNNCEVYLLDNTLQKETEISQRILDLLKENSVRLLLSNANYYGQLNKGAGEIEGVQFMHDEITKYDWFIHFEPRQLLSSHQFFESFFSRKRSLFTINDNKDAPTHFNTGLYATECKHILRFANSFTDHRMKKMILRGESIEYLLHDFYIKNEIPFETLDKMDLVWFDGTKEHKM